MTIWLLLLGVALVIWRLSQPSGDCVIRVRQGRVTTRGMLSLGRRAEIESFLAEEFPEVKRLRIDIHYGLRGRPLNVRIRGSLSPGERQLIRNFLTTLL